MHTDGDWYIGTKGNSKRVIYSDREQAPIAVITADPRTAAVSDANARLLVNANRMFKLIELLVGAQLISNAAFPDQERDCYRVAESILADIKIKEPV
jgi:hypothetical protein